MNGIRRPDPPSGTPAVFPPTRIALADLASTSSFYSARLVQALRAAGQPITFFASDFAPEPGYYESLGIEREHSIVDAYGRQLLSPRWVRLVLRHSQYLVNLTFFGRILRDNRFDVAHLEWLPLLYTFGLELPWLRWVRSSRTALVLTAHNVTRSDVSTDFHLRRQRAAYTLFDQIIVHTQTDYAFLTGSMGMSPARVTVTPHGPLFDDVPVAPGTVEALRERLRLTTDDHVLLMLGSMRDSKGQSLLLDALAAVRADLPTLRLVIGGRVLHPDDLARLRRQADRLGLNDVIRWDAGYVLSADVAVYHRLADTVLFPYTSISQSGAFLTAAGNGCFTLTTAVGGLAELTEDGVTGVQVARAEAGLLADGLRRCVALPPEERRAMGQRLKERVQATSNWQIAADRHIEAYAKSLAERARR